MLEHGQIGFGCIPAPLPAGPDSPPQLGRRGRAVQDDEARSIGGRHLAEFETLAAAQERRVDDGGLAAAKQPVRGRCQGLVGAPSRRGIVEA